MHATPLTTTKTFIRSRAMRILASQRLRNFQRQKARITRRLSGAAPQVHYFHQVDDPYSHLSVQKLGALAANYSIRVTPHLVSAPAADYLGDATKYWSWAATDAANIAPGYGANTDFVSDASEIKAIQNSLARVLGSAPPKELAQKFADTALAAHTGLTGMDTNSPTAEDALAAGNRLRRRLGHYLGAMFWFDGEWYWGLDRLHLLEQRLRLEGYAVDGTDLVAPLPAPPPLASADSTLLGTIVLEYFPSLRSPYTAVGQARVESLIERLGLSVQLKPVMPMLMRGIPAPVEKQRYILQDACREAEYYGVPFGNFVDPFGEPVKSAFALYPEAHRRGKGMEFVSAYLRAAFAEGIDITGRHGLEQVAETAGLDYNDLVSKTSIEGNNTKASPNWQALLEDNLQEMLAAGLWGVPSFRVTGGNAKTAYACWGQDRLWRLETEIIQRCNGD